METYVTTINGNHFDLIRPDRSVFNIETIAHALSHICRFTGHTNEFYSVAQHSVLVSQNVPHHQALAALLHDAAEAYIGDISSPLKSLLPDYKLIEKRVETALFAHFGLPATITAEIKHADLMLLATEKRDLMCDDEHEWEILEGICTLPEEIKPLGAVEARKLFLDRFEEITQPATKKLCPHMYGGCDSFLPLSEFHKNNRSADGHAGICRSCMAKRVKRREARLAKEQRKAIDRNWFLKKLKPQRKG